MKYQKIVNHGTITIVAKDRPSFRSHCIFSLILAAHIGLGSQSTKTPVYPTRAEQEDGSAQSQCYWSSHSRDRVHRNRHCSVSVCEEHKKRRHNQERAAPPGVTVGRN